MKAVQIVNPSEMKVVELEKPVVGAGEVLVRIKYVGFCVSDLNTFLGRNPMVKLPVVPGHEVVNHYESPFPFYPHRHLCLSGTGRFGSGSDASGQAESVAHIAGLYGAL